MSEGLVERWPRSLEVDGVGYEFRRMTAEDEAAVLEFARALPRHDLLFLRRDISNPKVMSAWVRDMQAGQIESLLALREGQVVGCSAVVTDKHGFSAHVGDLRVLLAPGERAHGLGRLLIQESFLLALSLGLEKLTTQMTSDQGAAVTVFEDMGFRPEALLHNHVRDVDGKDHDLVVLAHDVAAVQAKMALFGLDEAVGGEPSP